MTGLGSVGIGTTNPTATLDVIGDVKLAGEIRDVNNSAGTANYVLTSGGPGGNWTWKVVTDVGAGILDAVNIKQDGSNVGTGTATEFDFYENFSITQPSAGIASIRLAENINITGIDIDNTTSIGSTTSSLSTLTQTAIHTELAVATYRSVEYTIQATQGTNFHATKILALHNGTTAYHSEYGTIFNNSSVASFDVDISGGNLRLLATSASASQTDYVVNFVATKV
jgi:hypothetical protein